jgi:hypothetical protein
MAYIANTAFEVRVSNHEFDSVANITGKFLNGSDEPEICSAGFLCKRVALIDNEGYPAGTKNGNTWTMQAGAATDILFAANPHNVNEITDPISGNVYKVNRETLGLPIPAGVEDTFTMIRADGAHVYRFGVGNLTTALGSNGYLTCGTSTNAGKLVPAAAAPDAGSGIYFQVLGSGNFTQGAYAGFGYVDALALKA